MHRLWLAVVGRHEAAHAQVPLGELVPDIRQRQDEVVDQLVCGLWSVACLWSPESFRRRQGDAHLYPARQVSYRSPSSSGQIKWFGTSPVHRSGGQHCGGLNLDSGRNGAGLAPAVVVGGLTSGSGRSTGGGGSSAGSFGFDLVRFFFFTRAGSARVGFLDGGGGCASAGGGEEGRGASERLARIGPIVFSSISDAQVAQHDSSHAGGGDDGGVSGAGVGSGGSRDG